MGMSPHSCFSLLPRHQEVSLFLCCQNGLKLTSQMKGDRTPKTMSCKPCAFSSADYLRTFLQWLKFDRCTHHELRSKRRKESQSSAVLFEVTYLRPKTFHWASPLKFLPPPHDAKLRTKPFIHGFWGPFKIQTVANILSYLTNSLYNLGRGTSHEINFSM